MLEELISNGRMDTEQPTLRLLPTLPPTAAQQTAPSHHAADIVAEE